MDQEKSGLSKNTQKILKNIETLVKKCNHPMVEYKNGGVIRENFKNYDLTTEKGRAMFSELCGSQVIFQVRLELGELRKKDTHKHKRIPRTFQLNRDKLNPWLELMILIQDLAFQMETMDLVE